MKFDKKDKVVKAPDALNNPLYKLTKAVVKAENSLIGTKEEVLARATKMMKTSGFDDITVNKKEKLFLVMGY